MTDDRPLAAYIRVSRVGQRDEERLRSPQFQRDAIARFAQAEGFAVEWFPPEIDVSGAKAHRPVLDQIVAGVREGRLAGVVVAKLDRLSRMTPRDRVELFETIEDAGGVILSAGEQLDPSTPEGRFARDVFLGAARMAWERYAEGFRVAKENALARGVHIGPTPFGYRRTADGTLEVDPDRGPVVADAFAAAARADVGAAIALLVKRAPERTWTSFTTRRFLANRTYLGEVSQGRDGAHEPLVSRAVFEAAQHEPTGRRRPRGDFPLSNIAVCGSCDGHMVGGRGGGDNRRMYRCAVRCDQPAVVSADLLEAHVVGVLRADFEHPGFRIGVPSPDLDAAENRLLEAEAELDEFAADVEARRMLKHRYHAALQARVSAVDEAREQLRGALSANAQTRGVVPAELWESLEPAELAEVLRAALEAVIVSRGRRPVAERVRVVAK